MPRHSHSALTPVPSKTSVIGVSAPALPPLPAHSGIRDTGDHSKPDALQLWREVQRMLGEYRTLCYGCNTPTPED